MAASLIGGAAIGAVFGELLKAVLQTKDKAIMFKQTLFHLRSTLIAIAPIIKEIEKHNNDLGRPKEELQSLIREMEQGTNLISKCSKIHRLNLVAKVRYQEQLEALVDSLVMFFIIDMQAQTARDQKETLLKVTRILSAVNKFPFAAKTEETSQPGDENAGENNSSEEATTEDIEQVTRSFDPMDIDVNNDESGTSHSSTTEDIAAASSSAQEAIEPHNSILHEVAETQSNEQTLTPKKRFRRFRLPKIGGFSREAKKETPESPSPKNTHDPSLVYCKSCNACINESHSLYKGSSSYCSTCYSEKVLKGFVLNDSSDNFGLEDLLRASAELLGRGSYGKTYKATLEDGRTVVVKRLGGVVVREIEFKQKLENFQKLIPEHPNVLPLRANYYDRDEQLLIYDYMANGSFSRLLHDTREAGQNSLDWNSRMKISLGAAMGIAHIHSVTKKKFIHGNLNSFNVLVTEDLQGCISDFGFLNLVMVTNLKNSGYRAPEFVETRKLTQECDVYSFGVILCEMLSGKLPADFSRIDFQIVIEEGEWPDHQVFYIFPEDSIQQKQMLQMGRLAMECMTKMPEARPSMMEVVKRIQEIISFN